ncbi:Polysaccharide biosynthesis protein [Methyloligella halotolerans]|uniref:Polysaccharide biosynthesis protein n=1 Tax=Methyloligella halotolerans TaxID=1177755 RepID=A0A1E2S0Q1_9HYPH|nr:oligosaccharide flippase family protein [Methyloligella halotolerans]ODA68083.1 Polysaccharide biosynthesis protein [Methyloligella halotolerans]
MTTGAADTNPLSRAAALLGKGRALFTVSSMVSVARIAGAAAGFITQVLLARYLQASALGVFYSVVSLVAVAGLVAAYGYPAIAPRFISRYREKGRPDLVLAFITRARREATLYVLIGAVGIVAFGLLWPGLDHVTRMALIAAAAALPASASLRVNGSFAGSLRRFLLAYLPDTAIRPFLLFFGVLAFIALGIQFDAADVTWLVAGITSVIAFTQYALVQRDVPKMPSAPPPKRLVRIWRREALPLIIVVMFIEFFADVDILMLTPFISQAEVGIFGVCLKIAVLVGFAVQVAQYIVQPDLADAHARKSYAPIKKAMAKALGFPLAATLGAFALFAVWGNELLSLFGPEFAGAKVPLLILIVSQLVRALFGPNVALLTVLGAQTQNATLAICSIAVLGLSNILLAPAYGATGAALAVVIAMTFWMIGTSILLYRLSGLRTDALFLLTGGARQAEDA